MALHGGLFSYDSHCLSLPLLGGSLTAALLTPMALSLCRWVVDIFSTTPAAVGRAVTSVCLFVLGHGSKVLVYVNVMSPFVILYHCVCVCVVMNCNMPCSRASHPGSPTRSKLRWPIVGPY